MSTDAEKLEELDRYLLISADTHAGPDPEGYRAEFLTMVETAGSLYR